MSRNNEMDALSTLIGLGILSSGLNKSGEVDAIKRMSTSGKSPVSTSEQKVSPNESAKEAKELYDSYISVGFDEIQAFELLTLVLSK